MSKRHAPRVIKLGGSVLTGPRAYARAARWLAERVFDEALLVVVSAEKGVTDRLLAEAETIVDAPDARALDLLWATGELRSSALLALHLQARGVPACALNVHEAGVRITDGARDVQAAEIRRALEAHAVVIVPGFLGATARGRIVSLGRGGSDLSAVTLAAALGARECELIKDVPGYFTSDPAAHSDARHLTAIDFDTAMAMAGDGCELVQTGALAAARAQGVRLIITTTRAGDRRTTVSDGTPAGTNQGEDDAICHQNDSRRATLGA